MLSIVKKSLLLFLSFVLVSVSSNGVNILTDSINSGGGVTFPYIESKIFIQNAERTVLFVSRDGCEECIKAAELRCGVLIQKNVSCTIYLLVNNELNLLTLVPVENSNIKGLMRPVNSNYKYVFYIHSSMNDLLENGETLELRSKLNEIESLVNGVNNKPKLIYLVSSDNNVETQYIYLGNGRISKLGGKSSYYAFLYNDHSNKVDSLSRSELRTIEQVRKEFIEVMSKMSEENIVEKRIDELATRIRTLDLIIKDSVGCTRCTRLGSTCNRCPKVVSYEVENVYYNLAKDNANRNISIESRLSKFIEKVSVSSLFVSSEASDRIPNMENSIKIGDIGDTEVQEEISSRLGPNCSDLSEKDIELVEKIIASFGSHFDFELKQDYDEVCIAVSKMNNLEGAKIQDDSHEQTNYSTETCSISLALSLGNFHPELISELGTLSPENESKLIALCSSVLDEESLEVSLPLPYYSISGSFKSPTGGKLNAALLLVKSVSEESVVSSILGENKCSYEDLFNGGWRFEKKLRVWVRGSDNKVPLPIMVRYGITVDGRLAAFSLEEKEIVEYQRGVDVLLTDPSYCGSISSVFSDRCSSPSHIAGIRAATNEFRENALAELEEARKNAELAEHNSKRASRMAAEAIVRYEEAAEDEIRAIELADIATKLRNYHDKKRLFTERAIELATLEGDLTVATEKRAEASLQAAEALRKATEAEAKRREASLSARLAAEKATDKIRNALDIQRQLKIKLREETKLRSAYDSAVVAEERLKLVYAEAQESLEKIIKEEKESSEKYEKEMALLLEEENRLKEFIKDNYTQRKSLMVKLADFNTIISAKYDESISTRITLINKIDLGKEDLKSRKAELDNVLRLSAEKSAELMTISSTIDEYEKILDRLRRPIKKGDDTLVDYDKYNELTVKLDGLKNVFEVITKKLETLSLAQEEMDKTIKAKEKELELLISGLEAIEDRIARFEYLKIKIEEKSKEAAELFAKEAALSEKIQEIERIRKRKTLEIERLAAQQASAKSDISSTLAARGAALGTVRATLKEIEQAKKENEEETKKFRERFVTLSREADESISDLERVKKSVCRAIDEEKKSDDDFLEKSKKAKKLKESELEAAEKYVSSSSSQPPVDPKTPPIPEIKLKRIE
ncbi:coiled coil protein [Cryptosporidium ryanae]|uniref:coiled coil protein n=1 Tax=Cryptosporidium ryanae TaxID=515981 RepID=UPI003519E13F|nr:coiled coil protein [Cryptosporidium ryanae]